MIDGVEYILEDKAWILIRPSGTEPLIRIYAESTDEKTLNTILEGGREPVFRAVQK
jgi:phosphomannomutase